MEKITLEILPHSTEAPENLDLSGKALWYQRQLEELAPVRQYVAYCNEQVSSTWNLLQARLHETQRKLTETTIVPTTKPRKPRVAKATAGREEIVVAMIKLGLSDAEQRKMLKVMGYKNVTL